MQRGTTRSLELVLAVVLTVTLNYAHIHAQYEGPDYLKLLPLVSFAPILWFSLRSGVRSSYAAYIISFTTIGGMIAANFHLGLWYGVMFGMIKGFVFPALTVRSDKEAIPPLLWVLRVCAAWTLLEWLIAHVFGIAVTLPIQLYRFPYLIQPIAIFGFSSLSALVMMVNCLVALLLSSFTSDEKTQPFPIRRALFWTTGVILCWTSLSVLQWFVFAQSVTESVRVATLSPGVPPSGDLRPILNMTRSAGAQGADFIVWPEVYVIPPAFGQSCISYVESEIVPVITNFANFSSHLIVGCYETIPDSPACPLANLAITLSPNGTVLGVYGKEHPVFMIGEQSCLTDGYSTYSFGSNVAFSTLICYDMDFDDSSAIVSDMGASLILNPSEDWSAARNHFAASVFRAVENRVAVAKSDWGWDSVIIQPSGAIAAIFDSSSIHKEILISDVNLLPRNQRSGGKRIQHLMFPLLALLVSLSLLLHDSYLKSRRRSRVVSEHQVDMEERLI